MLKLYSLFLLLNIIIIFCDGGNDEYDPYNGYEGNNDNYENYDNGWYYNNENNINTGTISYELS